LTISEEKASTRKQGNSTMKIQDLRSEKIIGLGQPGHLSRRTCAISHVGEIWTGRKDFKSSGELAGLPG